MRLVPCRATILTPRRLLRDVVGLCLSPPPWIITLGLLLFVTLFEVVGAAAARAGELPYCNDRPGYYRVSASRIGTGGDLRALPSSRSEHVRSFQDGEVLFSDGKIEMKDGRTWLRIVDVSRGGWMHREQLYRTLPLTFAGTSLPLAARCASNEPLWSLNWDNSRFTIRLFPGQFEFGNAKVLGGTSPDTALVTAENDGASLTLVYQDHVCTDKEGTALSYGEVQMILRRNGETLLYNACCRAKQDAFAQR